jgi:hypothetical protein
MAIEVTLRGRLASLGRLRLECFIMGLLVSALACRHNQPAPTRFSVVAATTCGPEPSVEVLVFDKQTPIARALVTLSSPVSSGSRTLVTDSHGRALLNCLRCNAPPLTVPVQAPRVVSSANVLIDRADVGSLEAESCVVDIHAAGYSP